MEAGQNTCRRQERERATAICSRQVLPVSPDQLTTVDRIRLGGVCIVEVPARGLHGQRLYERWRMSQEECERAMAQAKTAEQRIRCYDEMVEGDGPSFDKWQAEIRRSIPFVGEATLGVERSAARTTGVEEYCVNEARSQLSNCRQQQLCERAACAGRNLPGCRSQGMIPAGMGALLALISGACPATEEAVSLVSSY